jgi:hypothetical protein
MLKHVVIFAMSLAGATAPYAAERAVIPATKVSQTQSVKTPAANAIDPVKQAWIRHAMDRLLDTEGDATGSPPHTAP